MSGKRAPESKWNRTMQVDRRRKMVAVTLSDEERAALDSLAKVRGKSKSRIVGELILAAMLCVALLGCKTKAQKAADEKDAKAFQAKLSTEAAVTKL